MILIIGGAYQGKRDYVLNNYPISNEDINDLSVDFNLDNKCLYHFELVGEYIYDHNIDENEYFDNIIDSLKDKIIIIEDIYSSVVPIDKRKRISREISGRFCSKLSSISDSVIRIYLGIPGVLK